MNENSFETILDTNKVFPCLGNKATTNYKTPSPKIKNHIFFKQKNGWDFSTIFARHSWEHLTLPPVLEKILLRVIPPQILEQAHRSVYTLYCRGSNNLPGSREDSKNKTWLKWRIGTSGVVAVGCRTGIDWQQHSSHYFRQYLLSIFLPIIYFSHWRLVFLPQLHWCFSSTLNKSNFQILGIFLTFT